MPYRTGCSRSSFRKLFFHKVALNWGPWLARTSKLSVLSMPSSIGLPTTTNRVETTVHVLCNLEQTLLSRNTQMKLGMLPSSYPHARVGQLATIKKATEREKRSMMPAPEPSASDSSIIPARQPLKSSNIEPVDKKSTPST